MIKAILPILGLAAVLLVAGGLFFYMQHSPTFEVTHVGVKGHVRIDPVALVKALHIPPHTNIFAIQPDVLQARVEALRWVKSAQVYRHFPNQLSIHLIERTPVALVKLDELRQIDSDGVVLGGLDTNSTRELPIMTGALVEQMQLDGENPEIRQAMQAITALKDSGQPFFQAVSKIRLESLDNATFFGRDEMPEIRVSLRDVSPILQRLTTIAAELQPAQIAAIDLRFDKRIIVTPNKS